MFRRAKVVLQRANTWLWTPVGLYFIGAVTGSAIALIWHGTLRYNMRDCVDLWQKWICNHLAFGAAHLIPFASAIGVVFTLSLRRLVSDANWAERTMLFVVLAIGPVAVLYSCFADRIFSPDGIVDPCNAAGKLEDLRAQVRRISKLKEKERQLQAMSNPTDADKQDLNATQTDIKKETRIHKEKREEYDPLCDINFTPTLVRSSTAWAGAANSLVFAVIASFEFWLMLMMRHAANRDHRDRVFWVFCMFCMWLPARLYTTWWQEFPRQGLAGGAGIALPPGINGPFLVGLLISGCLAAAWVFILRGQANPNTVLIGTVIASVSGVLSIVQWQFPSILQFIEAIIDTLNLYGCAVVAIAFGLTLHVLAPKV